MELFENRRFPCIFATVCDYPSKSFLNGTLLSSAYLCLTILGFSLELYIEQDEYIQGLADAAGVRLLIQNQTYMPFPEDFGISLMPGTKTSIGITRVSFKRKKITSTL